MIGSLLSYGLGYSHNESLSSWKLIFLVIGLLNVVWGFVFVKAHSYEIGFMLLMLIYSNT